MNNLENKKRLSMFCYTGNNLSKTSADKVVIISSRECPKQ